MQPGRFSGSKGRQATPRHRLDSRQWQADAKFAGYKPHTAFFFPGQGAQTVGMAKAPAPLRAAPQRRAHGQLTALCGTQDIAEGIPTAQKLFQQASSILGYDLLQTCIEGGIPRPHTAQPLRRAALPGQAALPGRAALLTQASPAAGPKDRLDSTVVSQPAIYVASLAALEKLRQEQGEVSHQQHAPAAAPVTAAPLTGPLSPGCGGGRRRVRPEPRRVHRAHLCRRHEVPAAAAARLAPHALPQLSTGAGAQL